ncbi:MAG TPA: histidine kinase, partial [Armatimonadota bacterium]|nr:histidine kinase [Armatimonadota bacterium]
MPSFLSALFGRSRRSVTSAQVLPPQQPDEEENRLIARRCAEAREEESRRIAGDLHDGPVQQLANLVLRLDMAEKVLPAEAADTRQELVQLRQFAKDTLQDLRRFLFELRPSARDEFSLLPTLRQYCLDFRTRYTIPVELSIEDADWSLESDIAANLFRVIQESLTNVRKHA